jgi:FAD/FMN-containing dehydrogenase
MEHIDARTMAGSHTTIDRAAVDALAGALRGRLLTAGDSEFDEARTLWNGMIDRRPALIARCLGVADVVACVNFARDHDVLLSIKSGGHNIAGLALADGALTIDTSLMRGVHVDVPGRRAHAQAGCLLGDVDRETQLHGLAAVLGFVSNTGIAGLTIGGGFGYLTRRFGWTSDTVQSFEVVTADGRRRQDRRGPRAGPVLGSPWRRRQLRRRHEHRVRALPRRPGDHGRCCRMARSGRTCRPRDVPPARR